MAATDRSARTVDIVELARQGRAVDGAVDLSGCQRLLPLLGEGPGELGYRLACKIDDQGRAAAVLTLHGDLPLTCDRCGEVVHYRVAHEADFFFVDDEQQLGSLPVVVDQPEPLPGGRAFDLLGLVEDEAILSLPISPRHVQCAPGEGRTGEPEQAGERPFAGLAGLLRRGH